MRRHLEDDLQKAVCEHLRLRAHSGVVWFAVPNGGKRNVREAARMKRMGVTAGVADIILLHNGKFFALELKALTGRISESQRAFLMAVDSAGGVCYVAYGIDEALRVLESWGLINPKF